MALTYTETGTENGADITTNTETETESDTVTEIHTDVYGYLLTLSDNCDTVSRVSRCGWLNL